MIHRRTKVAEHRAALTCLDDWLPYLAANPTPDVAWIVRENRKKHRLKRLLEP